MITLSLLLVVCCQAALAFQTQASGFRFVLSKKETLLNEAMSKQSPTTHLSFEGTAIPSVSTEDQKSLDLLNQAIASNSSAANLLLDALNAPENDKENFLDNLFSAIPEKGFPFFVRSKWSARYSRRARLASLGRTIDLLTSPDGQNTKTGNQSRRRRALALVIRLLSSEKSNSKQPVIVTLEKRARRASKESSADMKSRMPEGLETPMYDIMSSFKYGGKTVEIRRYKPYSVCAVNMNKPRPDTAKKTDREVRAPEISGASSFGALAGFLFGKNDQGLSMKMTTPVLTAGNQMEFVLPSNYWKEDSLGTAPKPLPGSGVSLQQRESQDRAVLMFGGYASKKEVAKRRKDLMAALKKDKHWTAAKEEATTAQYNDPFTAPWKRLNEVSIKVVPK